MPSNNDNSGAAIGVAIIVAVAVSIAAFIYAVAVFAAFVLSVVCLFAWNEPRSIGSITITPDEARSFVKRGLWGAFLVPVFLLFCEVALSFHANPDYLIYLMLAGYAAGSLGIEMLIANVPDTEPTIEQLPAPPAQIAPPRGFYPPAKTTFIPTPDSPKAPEEPQRNCRCFTFASWDDEEEFRR